MNSETFWWWISYVADAGITGTLAVLMGGAVARLFLREVAELRENWRQFRADDMDKRFDGTAPVGTLANGVSLYSSGGKLLAKGKGSITEI